MSLHVTSVTLALVLAFAGVAASAAAQTRQDHAKASTKKPRAKTFVVEPAPTGRIACTIGGCRPIPPNCTTTMGQTWTAATGYEIVHCP